MAKGLARGDSYAKLRDEIARRFGGQSVSNIMRVVQTEGTYVSRQVQGEEMQRAGFDAYYIDSVEDKHTCDTCRAISKRSHEEPFRFEDAKPGENYPPLHPRCRCEVNPSVDDWADFIKGGDGRPQDRAKVAERFGARPVDLHAREYGARARSKLEDRFRHVRFKTDRMKWKDCRELYDACDELSTASQVWLEEEGYARVMSELATYAPRILRGDGTITKEIDGYLYTAEVREHDYKIIRKRRIE